MKAWVLFSVIVLGLVLCFRFPDVYPRLTNVCYIIIPCFSLSSASALRKTV